MHNSILNIYQNYPPGKTKNSKTEKPPSEQGTSPTDRRFAAVEETSEIKSLKTALNQVSYISLNLDRSLALQFSHLFHLSRKLPQNTMDSQSQNTSLQRLQNVEKRIVRVLELAGGVMDEMANPSGPRKELINNHCSEFMQLIKDIQVTLREEIKSACEYRPFEKCDYVPRISNEICCKKLEYVISRFDDMQRTIEGYHAAASDHMSLD